jgi:hypothetical protein
VAEAGSPMSRASFPVGVFPEPIRGFVAAGSSAIGGGASSIALPLLSGLAAAIGNSRRIELKRGWTAPCVTRSAIVGESGAHKSPAVEIALRPLRERQHRAVLEPRVNMKVFEVDRARWKKELRTWERKGRSSDPPPEIEPRVCERTIVDDITTEALLTRLRDNPRGLLLVRNELAGWLGSFDRSSGGHGADAARWFRGVRRPSRR